MTDKHQHELPLFRRHEDINQEQGDPSFVVGPPPSTPLFWYALLIGESIAAACSVTILAMPERSSAMPRTAERSSATSSSELCDRIVAYVVIAVASALCVLVHYVFSYRMMASPFWRVKFCSATAVLFFFLTISAATIDVAILNESPECARSGFPFVFVQIHVALHALPFFLGFVAWTFYFACVRCFKT
jgi:hypothetical protein